MWKSLFLQRKYDLLETEKKCDEYMLILHKLLLGPIYYYLF